MTRKFLVSILAVVAMAIALPALALNARTDPDFLPVHQAFSMSFTEMPDAVMVHVLAAPGYYLYKSKLGVEALGRDVTAGQAILPAGEEKSDPYFGDVVVYHGAVDVRIPIRNAGHSPFTLKVGFQGCAEKGLCYPPDSQSFEIGRGAGTAGMFVWSWSSVALAFLAGLALCINPITLMVVPILGLTGLIGPVTRPSILARGALFGLSMVAGYTIASTITGHLGPHYNVMGKLQSAWLLIPTIGMLWIAAVHAFKSGSLERYMALAAACLLGFSSSVVIAPWVSSPLARIISGLAAGSDWIGGALEIFALGLGLSIPMVVVTCMIVSVAARRALALSALRRTCAVLVAIVGIWVAARIIPDQAALAITCLFTVFVGIHLGVFDTQRKLKLIGQKGLGIAVFLYGLTALVGTLKGETDPLNPLGVAWGSGAATSPLTWTTVSTPSRLAGALLEAKTAGVPAVVEWDAKWCVGCKPIEAFSKRSAAAAQELQGFKLIRVDVTVDDQDSRDLMAMNGQLGPPALQFYQQNGVEAVGQRVTGQGSNDDLMRAIDLTSE